VHWSAAHRPIDFFDAKGIVEAVADALRVDVTFAGPAPPSYLTPGRAASISSAGRIVGSVGLVARSIVSLAGMTDDVYVGELDLDALASLRSITPLTVTPLPRYPSIARDISMIVDETLPAGTVRGTIRAAAPDTLVSIREFDRYQGKGVPDGRVSLSLRLTFRSLERTLTDAEVETAMKQILDALKHAHNAIQR
jgi:phenylalanyl-tRNA synthetase beta chain